MDKYPLIVAHYMSWFQAPDFSKSWGFWQVNRPTIKKEYWHFPEKRNEKGWRDISSVYYPVIGPYDSGDPDLCEYHITLAKLAGIDGFVADWYGPDSSKEHPYDNTGFKTMRDKAAEMDFKVMICWEDRSMFPPISSGVKNRDEAIKRGQEMIEYLDKEWFSSRAYLKIEDRPVLTNFAWKSPGTNVTEPWLSASEWDSVFSVLEKRPVFIHDWHHHREINEFEEYESVMPWGCAYHGEVDSRPEFWSRSKDSLGKGRFAFLSGTLLPGFDNRGCEGWGTDGEIGITDRRDGEKFKACWKEVREHDVKFIQIATWNDLNEGGTIEPVRSGISDKNYPAEGYGYRELETVQENAGELKGIKVDKAGLRLPALIYLCRKMLDAKEEDIDVQFYIQQKIDASRDLLLQGNTELAKKCIKEVYAGFSEKLRKNPDFKVYEE